MVLPPGRKAVLRRIGVRRRAVGENGELHRRTLKHVALYTLSNADQPAALIVDDADLGVA